MPVYTYTTLDDPSANNNTQAFGINASGQIVGQYTDASNHTHGFLYSNGTYTTLDDPSASATGGTFALGINDLGQIVGVYGDARAGDRFLSINKNYPTPPEPLAATITTAIGSPHAGTTVTTYRSL